MLLIAEDGERLGIVKTAEALQMAQDKSLDLVEISPDATPPVCKMMNYGKRQYDKKKKAAQARKKQRQTQLKELKFRPVTDKGDFEVKIKKLREFIEEGDKVKIVMRFKGREIAHSALGSDMLDRIKEAVSDIANVEQEAKFEGRQMLLVLGPKKK